MLDVHNQSIFDRLERNYLYDIPECEEEAELVTCMYCDGTFSKDNINKLLFDGEYYCKHCARLLYEMGEISREELEEAYGEI